MRRISTIALASLVLLALPAIAQAAPTQTQPSRIVGTPAVAQFLTCSLGTWSSNPTSYSYRWIKNGSVGPWIFMNSTFQVTPADAGEIRCQVSVTTSEGTAEGAVSAPVTVPPYRLVATKKPTLDGFGKPLPSLWVGDGLQCMPATWSGPVDLPTKITWVRNGKVISDWAAHTIDASDVGKRISCRESATFMGLSTSVDSASTYIKPRPLRATSRARIGGTPSPGGRLVCSGWAFNQANLIVTLAWLRNGRVIPETNYTEYPVKSSDVRSRISCRASVSTATSKTSTTSPSLTIRSR